MPVETWSETLRSAKKSPKARETFSTTIASLTRHLDGGGHAGAQPVIAFRPSLASLFRADRASGGSARAALGPVRAIPQADARGEHLVGALVGGLQVARRVLAHAVDVLHDAREGLLGERVDAD